MINFFSIKNSILTDILISQIGLACIAISLCFLGKTLSLKSQATENPAQQQWPIVVLLIVIKTGAGLLLLQFFPLSLKITSLVKILIICPSSILAIFYGMLCQKNSYIILLLCLSTLLITSIASFFLVDLGSILSMGYYGGMVIIFLLSKKFFPNLRRSQSYPQIKPIAFTLIALLVYIFVGYHHLYFSLTEFLTFQDWLYVSLYYLLILLFTSWLLKLFHLSQTFYPSIILTSILHDPYYASLLALAYYPSLVAPLLYICGGGEMVLALLITYTCIPLKRTLLIVNPYLVPKDFTAITLYPFIVCCDKKMISTTLINHEKIHLQQQKELLIVGFYILYLVHYFINLLRYRDRYLAYREIMFEKEAYAHEQNFLYLKQRKRWAFWAYW